MRMALTWVLAVEEDGKGVFGLLEGRTYKTW